MTTLLMMMVLFLGYNLFIGNQNKAPDPRTTTQLLEEMRALDKAIKDQSIVSLAAQLHSKVEADVKAKKLSKQQGDKLGAEATMLVAHTQFKAALQRKDFNRMNQAFMTFQSQRHQLETNGLWTAAFSLPPHKDFPRTEWSPKELLHDINVNMTALGRTTLVWGLVPGFQLIDFLVNLTGAQAGFSYAFAALLLALVVRAIIWPMAQKQYMWSRQMSQLQPLVAELKKRYTAPQELNVKVMELYKEYGINPMAGCLPALLQMPLFLLVYQCMLHYQYEFQKGTFLWIQPGSSLGSFFAHNLGEKDNLLIILYGISMLSTTLLTPVSDPANAKQQRMIGVAMSVLFTVFMFTGVFPVPAAFVLYWIGTNVLATAQSLRAYRLPLPALVKVNAPGGGVYPTIATNGSMNGASGKTGAPKMHKPKKKRK